MSASMKNNNLSKIFLTLLSSSLSLSSLAITPKPGWADSYSVNGKCYCATTYDHGIGNYKVNTPIGSQSVAQICEAIGPGPGKGNNPVYNTVQCGHEPGHNDKIRINGELVADEKVCPGRVDLGSNGCDIKGPKWDLSIFGATNNNSTNENTNTNGNTSLLSVTKTITNCNQSGKPRNIIDVSTSTSVDNVSISRGMLLNNSNNNYRFRDANLDRGKVYTYKITATDNGAIVDTMSIDIKSVSSCN